MERELDGNVKEEMAVVVPVVPEHAPSPYRAVLDRSAKVSGYAGFGFLLLAVGTGAFRRRLKSPFKAAHRWAAWGVILTMLLHSIYFLKTLGLPPLLWFVMGVVSSGVLLVTGTSGYFRRRLRRWFIKTHVTAAVIALVAAIVHWAWIYI
jgi:hypothetical protein